MDYHTALLALKVLSNNIIFGFFSQLYYHMGGLDRGVKIYRTCPRKA